MIGLFIIWIISTAGFGQECEYVYGNQCPYDTVPDKGCGLDIEGPSERLMGLGVSLIDSVQYPYVVSLQLLECGNHILGTGCYKHFCGGTMISPNLILTTAHCFDDIKSHSPRSRLDGLKYYTHSQEIYAAISPPCRHLGNGKYGRFEVNNIFIHPEYQKQVVPQNDVAILDIIRNREGQFYEGPLVEVVGEEELGSLVEAQVLGYGQAQPQHVAKYVVYPLHGAKLQLLTPEFCQEFLNQFGNERSSELNYTNMVCYWNMNADACHGDSGGPLLTSQGIQIGLVSWGPGTTCLDVNATQGPGVYVRLTLFANWIQQIMQALRVDPNELASTPTQQPSPLTELEANALLAFKNSIKNSSQLLSWTGLDACKNWVGIFCQNNRVVEISLGDHNWNVGDLLTKQSQSLLLENVGTSIPDQWSIMDNLKKIQLGEIGLTGSLPLWLSQIKTLKVLDMDEGNLKGTLPKQYSTLVSLVVIDISDNDLTGTLPVELSTLSQLQRLDIAANRLRGTLPTQYSLLTSLNTILLFSNSLTGTVPVWFSTLTSLEGFYASLNSLIGTLPPEYSQLTSLNYFNLRENSLTGTLPQQYSELVNLKQFYLNGNKLAGSVHPQYSKVSGAQTIFFPQVGDLLCLDRQYASIDDGSNTIYC